MKNLPVLHVLSQFALYKVALFNARIKIQALEEELKELRGSGLGDTYVVVTERDTDDPFKSDGAIVHETYTGRSNIVKAVERAGQIGNRYGQRWICRLQVVGTYAHCDKLINQPVDQFKGY